MLRPVQRTWRRHRIVHHRRIEQPNALGPERAERLLLDHEAEARFLAMLEVVAHRHDEAIFLRHLEIGHPIGGLASIPLNVGGLQLE